MGGLKKYHLNNLMGEQMEGSFYDLELQSVMYSNMNKFFIEKIVKKMGVRKNNEIFVKPEGWPGKFNSWIPANTVRETWMSST